LRQYQNGIYKTRFYFQYRFGMISVFDVHLFRETENNFMLSEKVRSIRLPENVWDALDADAARCRRSSQKQIEALLVSFYELENVEINKQSLEVLGELMPKAKTKLPVIKTNAENRKEKKTA